MADYSPKCRHCDAALTQTLVDLGLSPLANSFIPVDAADRPEPRYPLHARVCGSCFLVQVDDVVPAEQIFSDEYAYFSSYSDSWLKHSKAYAEMMRDRLSLDADALVIEIASNDGYLLQNFVTMGVPVLGVEPSANTAVEAEKKGVSTRVEFFTEKFARILQAEGHRPDLICSANVLAHVPDINDFVAGIAVLLENDAVYTVEFPHLLNLIQQTQFDTIYHEHYSYLSLLTVERIFARAGLRVFDVEALPTHGGSLRVFACLEIASHTQTERVAENRAREHATALDRSEGYVGFDKQVLAVRDGLVSFLQTARAEGRSVAAYGAAAKGNTLLNYCGIGPELISFAVDRNPAKQNKLLPGSRIPVHSEDALAAARPDFVVILPWNLKAEIIKQLGGLADAGTRFVTAIPEISISR